MKKFLFGLGVALVAVVAASALAAGSQAAASKTAKSATLVIRHQRQGCHSWSLNGGAYKAAQVIHVARGTTLTIVNNDVMPQKLFEKGGPAVRYSGSPAMTHMGALVKVSFPKAGIYSFFTKAGEDYSWVNKKAAETAGEDNVLTLKTIIS